MYGAALLDALLDGRTLADYMVGSIKDSTQSILKDAAEALQPEPGPGEEGLSACERDAKKLNDAYFKVRGTPPWAHLGTKTASRALWAAYQARGCDDQLLQHDLRGAGGWRAWL